jgi:hypothetical protein
MSRPGYTISNEELLLINILNGMYNDNLRQIDRMNASINTLNADNSRMRNLLIRLLRNQGQNNNRSQNNAGRGQNNNRTHNNERTPPLNTSFPSSIFGSSGGLGRLFVNNAPYIIDSIPAGGTARNFFSETLRNFYEPVNVYPTQAQMAAATRIVRYSDIVTPRNRSCPISIVDFNDSDMVTIIRNCGHIFHTRELRTWFATHCTCPVCRFDIREARNNSSNNNDTPSASENITRASENITSAVENIIRATDNIIGEAERQAPESNEERTATSTSTESPPETTTSRSGSEGVYSLSDIVDGLFNAFDVQDVEIMISDLSNNLMATPDPQTLYSLVSRFNNNNNVPRR